MSNHEQSAVEWVNERIILIAVEPAYKVPRCEFVGIADALELAQRCAAAERRLKTAEWNLIESANMFDKANNDLRTKLAAAERTVERLREVLRLIQWSGGGHTDEGLYCNGSWCAEQARAALAETKEDASNE